MLIQGGGAICAALDLAGAMFTVAECAGVCDNATDPGKIKGNQTLCGPGVDPAPIMNDGLPSGGTGALEYIWIRSEELAPFSSTLWEVIPNTNSPNYDPGPLSKTTYFARCVRRDGCVDVIESNVVTITVGNEAVAEILAPGTICTKTEITYEAKDNGPALYEWDLGLGASPQFVNGRVVKTKYENFGRRTIKLSVTRNGCTSVESRIIFVADCSGGLVASVDIYNKRDVMVKWEINPNVQGIDFAVEMSTNGSDFQEVGTADAPIRVGSVDRYVFIHTGAKMGRSYYRVHMIDAKGNDIYTDPQEVVLFNGPDQVMAYPNPVQDQLTLEILDNLNSQTEVRIFTATGKLMQIRQLDRSDLRMELDWHNYPAGVYYLQVKVNGQETSMMKLVKL